MLVSYPDPLYWVVHPSPRCCGCWLLIAHTCTLAWSYPLAAESWRCGKLQVLLFQEASWPMVDQWESPRAQNPCFWGLDVPGLPRDQLVARFSRTSLLSFFLCLILLLSLFLQVSPESTSSIYIICPRIPSQGLSRDLT